MGSETLFSYGLRSVRIPLDYIEDSKIYVFKKWGLHDVKAMLVIRLDKRKIHSIEVHETMLDEKIRNLSFHLRRSEERLLSLYSKYVKSMLEELKSDIRINFTDTVGDYLAEFLERPVETLSKIIICLESHRERITLLAKILNMVYELWLMHFLLKEVAYSFTVNREQTLRKTYIFRFEGPLGNKYRMYWNTIPEFLRDRVLEAYQKHKIPDIIIVNDRSGEVKLIIEAKLGHYREKQISEICSQIEDYMDLYKPKTIILTSITELPNKLKSELTRIKVKVIEKIYPGSENLKKLRDLAYEALSESTLIPWFTV